MGKNRIPTAWGLAVAICAMAVAVTPVMASAYPDWVAGQNYVTGDIVKYTNGQLYIATHDNPGYDPVISTWYWSPYTPSPPSSGFIISEATFNQMFPNRNPFYTYSALVTATAAYPAFCATGTETVKCQEAAAFLANVAHETGQLSAIIEENTANYGHYCDQSQSYGCPAGQSAYYGRGPIQLSWNYNYKAAGDALGVDLLNNPNLVATDAVISWKTAVNYWMNPASSSPHNVMINQQGFGETIRYINGALECNGGNPAQVQSRVNYYTTYSQALGCDPGSNLSC